MSPDLQKYVELESAATIDEVENVRSSSALEIHVSDNDNAGGYRLDRSYTRLPNSSVTDLHALGIESSPPKKQLSFLSVFALVVGSSIGSGIFASPSRVDNNVPSPGVAMLIWAVAGVISLTGAASFGELGVTIPRNGGMQEYLRFIYGDLLASIMSWTWIMALKPSAMAVLGIIFAEYWTTVIFSSDSAPLWQTKALAIGTISFVLILNCASATISTRFTNLLMISKLSTVALILLIAVLTATVGLSYDQAPNQDWRSKNWFSTRSNNTHAASISWKAMEAWDAMGHFTSALYAALWACSGWDNVCLSPLLTFTNFKRSGI